MFTLNSFPNVNAKMEIVTNDFVGFRRGSCSITGYLVMLFKVH